MSKLYSISILALKHTCARPSLTGFCMLIGLGTASAYRALDGTHAAGVDKDKMEIELQPARLLKDASGKTLIAPAARFNYGYTENWEAVLEGRFENPLSPSGPASLREAGAFLKGVLREGSLQEKTGPSVATEVGVLLPDSQGPSGFGASVAGIVSRRWDWGAIHLNGVAELSREHRADLFTSVIIEGPSKWTVRPVAEVFYEKEFGTISGLAGLIWQVREDLSFDVGVRHALTNGHPVNELRAGMTVSFSVLPARSLHH